VNHIEVVGVADMKVGNDPGVTLATYSLGSCIGVVIYDPEAGAGGILHYMLPESSLDREKAERNPCMFGDTGIPLLFRAAYKLGAQKQRMVVNVVGGAQMLDDSGFFNIGKRNILMMKKVFWRNNVIVSGESVGGTVNRTVRLHLASGEVLLKERGKEMAMG
jgi:chemotaxis protein CheD